MEYLRLIRIAIFFRLLISSTAILFRYGPTDTTMAVGKTAVLQCAVSLQNNHEVVSWFHVETNRILSHDDSILTLEDRFSVIGNREGKGEYYLTIRNVQRIDEGEYRCISGPDFRSAHLKVTLPPPQDYPVCDVEPAPTTNQPGQLTQLSCSSNGGNPPARLTWKRQGVIISPTIKNANKLQRIVYEEDNGIPYTCSASSAAMQYPRTCTVMVLNVPPTSEIKPLKSEIRAGDTATFECVGNGLPVVTSYQWLVNYSVVNKGTIPRYSLDKSNQTLTISSVRRWEHGSLIICEVAVKSGLKGRSSTRLNVHTPPVTVGKGTKPIPTLAATVHPSTFTQSVNPKGKVRSMTGHTGAVIGSIIGTLLLLTVVLVLTCMVLRVKLKQMGFDIIPFGKEADKSSNGDAIPIYAKPNKIRKELGDAPPLPDAPRPDRSTLPRMATLPRAADMESKPKMKVKKHFSNYERIDLVPRRVSFLDTKNDSSQETDQTLATSTPPNSDGIVYADLQLDKNRTISAPDVVSSNRPDMVAYAQLRI